ncbi:MAG: hypothetical protein M3Z26_18175 [Bacteroidota bacterium]|nr:hypothetical protein [Bacteroidota bacterium]
MEQLKQKPCLDFNVLIQHGVFLQKLIDEQNAIRDDIVHIKSSQLPKSKKKNGRLEKRLLHLISNPRQDIPTQLNRQ